MTFLTLTCWVSASSHLEDKHFDKLQRRRGCEQTFLFIHFAHWLEVFCNKPTAVHAEAFINVNPSDTYGPISFLVPTLFHISFNPHSAIELSKFFCPGRSDSLRIQQFSLFGHPRSCHVKHLAQLQLERDHDVFPPYLPLVRDKFPESQYFWKLKDSMDVLSSVHDSSFWPRKSSWSVCWRIFRGTLFSTLFSCCDCAPGNDTMTGAVRAARRKRRRTLFIFPTTLFWSYLPRPPLKICVWPGGQIPRSRVRRTRTLFAELAWPLCPHHSLQFFLSAICCTCLSEAFPFAFQCRNAALAIRCGAMFLDIFSSDVQSSKDWALILFESPENVNFWDLHSDVCWHYSLLAVCTGRTLTALFQPYPCSVYANGVRTLCVRPFASWIRRSRSQQRFRRWRSDTPRTPRHSRDYTIWPSWPPLRFSWSSLSHQTHKLTKLDSSRSIGVFPSHRLTTVSANSSMLCWSGFWLPLACQRHLSTPESAPEADDPTGKTS